MEPCCTRFTPAEGGARLAAAAGVRNILAVEHSNFIATRLVHEEAHSIRGSLSDGHQRSVYVTRPSRVQYVAYELNIMTDLSIIQAVKYDNVFDWSAELDKKEVLVCTSQVLKQILEEKILTMKNINVLILDSCHLIFKDENLQYIMYLYKQCDDSKRPRILALTYPLFASSKKDNNKKDKGVFNPITTELKDDNLPKNIENEDENKDEKSSKKQIKTDSKSEKHVEDDNNVSESKDKSNNQEFDSKNEIENSIEQHKIETLENERDSQCDTDRILKQKDTVEIGVYENLDDFDMYEKLEWKIEELEKDLCCQMDLAEDIDGGKRLSSTIAKPKELIIEYNSRPSDATLSEAYRELDKYMRDTVIDALEFINDHRHDPTEIYGDELYEEFKNIPDPTIEPKLIFNQFLYVLDQLGPYAADKAAFSLLTKLEKLKIKVPYERHFLLLCLCTTVFVKIRCYADILFSKYESDWEKIHEFCGPKVLRFAEILEKFQPPEHCIRTDANNDKTQNKIGSTNMDNTIDNTQNSHESIAKMLNDIEKCDFTTLGNKIEDRVNTYEANLKDIDEICSETVSKKDNDQITSDNVTESVDSTYMVLDSTKEELDVNQSNLDDKQNHIDLGTQNKRDTMESSIDDTRSKVDSTHTSTDTILNNNINSVHNEGVCTQNNTNATQNKPHSTENNVDNPQNNTDRTQNVAPKMIGFTRRTGHRVRGRGRVQRNNAARVQQMQQNPDALCGIVFMKEPLMAKIMFMLIVDMSRCNPKLSYLCGQYCAVEAAGRTELRECQRQGKMQEDVLKKFRMHECNLLLATSALEEGIDLPRCNLVLRWDVPPSYRSYGLCRGRARAPRSTSALLCSDKPPHTDTLLHNLATYRELDQIISRKCGCGIQDEPPQSEEDHADSFTPFIKPYSPIDCKNNNIETSQDINQSDTKDTDIRIDGDLKGYSEIERNCCDTKIDHEENDTVKVLNCDFCENFGNIDKTDSKVDEKSNVNNSQSKCDIADEKIPNLNDKIEKDIRMTGDNENLICNKCNNIKNSVNECPCVLSVGINKVITGIDKDTDGISRNTGGIRNDINGIRYVVKSDCDSVASVDLSSAIALINRYCGKLPSDTFTRLAPQWRTERVQLPGCDSTNSKTAFICTLRLPLNCPVKCNIVGHPMATRVLARRMVALQACRILHKSGELDNQLMPIGKENFKAAELESSNCNDKEATDSARPGTTKRRQYYYKRTAWAFTDCQPVMDTSDSEIDPPEGVERLTSEAKCYTTGEGKKGTKRNMLYAIVSKLWCALPERYNTRGRRLHAPQHASQAIGVLMARTEPDNLQIPSFPVYTRSGEVRVSVEHVPDADVRMSPRRGRLVRRFMRFVFAEVLRVRRRGMKLQSEGSTHNNYYIVPTVKTAREDGTAKIDIDWAFLELIYQHTEDKKHSELEKTILWTNDEEEVVDVEKSEEKDTEKQEGKVKKMENPLLKTGETFVFDAEKYREAVVTPWYRNQDQPQFFLVAEICGNLTPDSAFPSATHTSFRDYYQSKYSVVLTQPDQPLLDVDHTSARLNLLTPRYVNRKGVALPVSSERTRRAKRDRLDQKQILVPELCKVHPFAAPLWFATVALPCVLYRINALLIADEIRRAVAIDVGLGVPKIDETTIPGFQWPPLDFGWSLAEVLSADTDKNEKKKDDDDSLKKEPREKDTIEKEETPRKDIEDDQKEQTETKEKTINDILQEKEDAESGFEIGTWSNDMASSIPQEMEYDEYLEPLPPNLTFCTSASGGTNWCDPIEKPKSQFNPTRNYSMAESDCSYMSSDFDTSDSDLDSEGSDEDTDNSGFCSSKHSNAAMGVRIEYKTAHEAEAVDVERKTKTNPAPQPDEEDDLRDKMEHEVFIRAGKAPDEYIQKFRQSVDQHKEEITKNGLIKHTLPITELLPELNTSKSVQKSTLDETELHELFPYSKEKIEIKNGQISLESIERNKRVILESLKKNMTKDEVKQMHCFSMTDVDIDSANYVNEKIVNVGFDAKEDYEKCGVKSEFKPYYLDSKEQNGKEFDFDYQPELNGHPGPSPSVILQALTMSNANDGINLERLETIGDSFLKFAITAYLYCAHPTVHEGKLSHMRSKQVSNLNLYRLGRGKRLGARMIASKFEPHDNWLPPCHKPPATLHPALASDSKEQCQQSTEAPSEAVGCFIPYNLITQHSIPDKSIADCVEALIGAYLLECGPRGALLFMSWLGIRVLPRHHVALAPPAGARAAAHCQKPSPPPTPKRQRHSSSSSECSSDDDEQPQVQDETYAEEEWWWRNRRVGSLRPYKDESGQWMQPIYGELKAPPSPLLRYIDDPEGELERMLSGYEALENTLQYRFKDRSLLLQALTHASHHNNRLTDCYQRLEFLGDAILDYLITRHLYEDPRRHSPGALTDLRSALVNNTIFATLAARHGFHKYFRHMSPGLNEVLTKYVKIQEENGHSISEEHYLIQEDEMEQAEDVEVPKALGDLFESVAGAIFLDSGMSLGAVWKSYVKLMGHELEAFSAAAPKSPVRELLEAEPDTAKFGKPERLADGRRVRVCVEVFGRGAFKGVGRNYRIAKGTAARCALRHLRIHRQK